MICGEHDIRACKTYLTRIINEARSALELLSQPNVTHYRDAASYGGGSRQSYTRGQLESAYAMVGTIEHFFRNNINKQDDKT